MKNNPIPNRLRELSWRGELSPAEQAEVNAWLEAHPESLGEWEVETGLSQGLQRLPNVPVASNFTARAVEAAQRAGSTPARGAWPRWLERFGRLKWLPRTAFAAVFLSAGLLAVRQVQDHRRVEKYARSVTVVAEVSSLPSPEILQNFDAIRELPPVEPDEELLKALE